MRFFANNMIGRQYPFFLNNQDLSSSYYLYQIYSPKLDENYEPYFSLTKISEKTKASENDPSKDSDLLNSCIGAKEVDEKAIKWLNEAMKKDGGNFVIGDSKDDFPYFSQSFGNGVQRSLIVNLRDSLRWRNYRFLEGKFVDILWTKTEYVVFRICGDENSVWLEPVAAYKNSDVEQKNPISIDINKISFKPTKFSKTMGKYASELNHAIKNMEWDSFSRKFLIEREKPTTKDTVEE